MIDSVPNHVHQRVAQLFDDELVDLSLRPGNHQTNFFLYLTTDLTHYPSEALEYLTQGDHAHFENARLHFAESSLKASMQPLQIHGERTLSLTSNTLGDARQRTAHKRELSDDIH